MIDHFRHIFVELIPKEPDEGMLYISLEHAVAVHLCACGCGWKVVTPLSPVHWKMIFDGRSVSLSPSIGNHAFPCKSHYWIESGRVEWSYEMTPKEVEAVRSHDRSRRRQFYEEDIEPERPLQSSTTSVESGLSGWHRDARKRPWWKRLFG